ncbi:hypothetical protein SERLA73DRAFT_161484 [Serpula lacrymans var. lacrymans S7.3]|uniref:SMODS and SLOG-associating 2TM effector domain-containing protein n=1 Tax=Serpula lacrymans var. lacrymans (strain S7.3) TaxID=936435 RepID=F8Q2P0_SERL3|nr:hypothetical protein SERLA73DRAFT_161484 [Serpula lacrymans var. lacrymans S7.3]
MEHESNLPALPTGVQNSQSNRHGQEDVSRHGEPTLTITQPLDTGAVYSTPDAQARPQSSSTGKYLSDSAEDHSPASALHPSNNVFSDDHNVNRHLSGVASLPPPARSRDGHNGIRGPGRRATMGAAPGLDWIVPVEETTKTHVTPRRTLHERIQPTLEVAVTERDKYAKKAMWTGYALNAAIGLQVLLGALTTAISAATTGRQASGLSTLVASYLARARGSNEPELSITRVKDLEQFIRDCKAFQMDHGHMYGDEKMDSIDAWKTYDEGLKNY